MAAIPVLCGLGRLVARPSRRRRGLGVVLVVGCSAVVFAAASAGCGRSATQRSTAARACSDSESAAALASPLSALNSAALAVWAGHGDVKALGTAAPRVVSASRLVRAAVNDNSPCRTRLVRATAHLLTATREMSTAGKILARLAAAAYAGKDYSTFQSQFLNDWFQGYPDFEQALRSLRGAGVAGVVRASDGKRIFTAAGCAMCHRLTAAGARGSLGPDLDAVKPSKADVVTYVTNGGGTMPALNGTLSARQIRAVARFVSENAGK